MKYTIGQIQRLSFMKALESLVREERYNGAEMDFIKEILKSFNKDEWSDMVDDLLRSVSKMEDKEIESLLNQLPPGYLKFRVWDFRMTLKERNNETLPESSG